MHLQSVRSEEVRHVPEACFLDHAILAVVFGLRFGNTAIGVVGCGWGLGRHCVLDVDEWRLEDSCCNE